MDYSQSEILKNCIVLYLEDEDEIRDAVAKTMKLFCKDVIDVSNINDAKKAFLRNSPHIILTDIELKGENGIDFVKYIRQIDKDIPIIVMSAFTEKDYLLESIKLKLTDYLVKPVDFDELFGVFKQAASYIIDSGSFYIKFASGAVYDLLNNTVIYEGNSYVLTIAESRLIEILFKFKSRTVTTEEIKLYVWFDEMASDGALKSLLNKLRVKIGKDSIRNVSRVGYSLVLQ
jgi:DNA-binding response OmpR family regulator